MAATTSGFPETPRTSMVTLPGHFATPVNRALVYLSLLKKAYSRTPGVWSAAAPVVGGMFASGP